MAKTMDRRAFLSFAAGSVAVGALIVLNGCSGGSDSSSTTEPTKTYADEKGEISSNHGHSVTLTAAQQEAGADVRLTLTSGGGHTHTVSLTAADVATVVAGTQWSKNSSSDSGHSHKVTFN